jgi:hypothetical protein
MNTGEIIAIFTFPGVILHELAHKWFCDRFGIKVKKAVYFRLGNPAGYVVHESPTRYAQIFWISVGPLIVNSLSAILLSLISKGIMDNSKIRYGLIWLALSAGMHAFPSDQDMKSITAATSYKIKHTGNPLFLLAYLLVGLVWLANKLRIIWFDLIYALFLIII